MSWLDVHRLDKDRAILYLPISPIEEHGPHLPLGTDFFAARDIAEMAARQVVERESTLSTVLAPVIPLGCSATTADFPGTVSLRGTTVARVAAEVCSSFARAGFRYIILSNHHLEPVHMKALLTAIQEVNGLYPDTRIVEMASRIFYSSLMAEEAALIERMGLDVRKEVHAEARETSFIRHAYPHLLKDDFRQLPSVLIDVQEGSKQGHKTFKQMGADQGYVGSPAEATEELGRMHLEELAGLTADFTLKLYRGESLPEMNEKMRVFLDSFVELD